MKYEPLEQDDTFRRNKRFVIDLVEILSCSTRNIQWIIVMQDCYTKCVKLVAMPNKQATTVANSMIDSWICQRGYPENLHSGEGNEFEAGVFTEVCK